jgi:hypothetical protein
MRKDGSVDDGDDEDDDIDELDLPGGSGGGGVGSSSGGNAVCINSHPGGMLPCEGSDVIGVDGGAGGSLGGGGGAKAKRSKRPVTPPPPRFTTDWSVRPSSDAEKTSFREQVGP